MLIGRNEAKRLGPALACAQAAVGTVVYVDSGSTDRSLAIAARAGVDIVRLDPALSFCAARARNQGFTRLMQILPDIQFVQFIDADCQLDAGWIPAALAVLQARPDLAVVCGRRREQYPHASIYNALMDREWNTPVGAARACGGDALVRVAAFNAAGGFDPTIIAGEEPELCHRLRRRGWKIHRLDAEMTRHDAEIHSLGQWFARDIRTGYGTLDIARRCDDPHYAAIVRSARLWALAWPAGVILAPIAAAIFLGPWAGALVAAACLLLVPTQIMRIALRRRRAAVPWSLAVADAALSMIGKWPQLLGQLRYHRDRARRRPACLIEYKPARPATTRSAAIQDAAAQDAA